MGTRDNSIQLTRVVFEVRKASVNCSTLALKRKDHFKKLNIPRKRNGRRESFIPMDIKGA